MNTRAWWNAVEQWVAGEQIRGGSDYQEDNFALTLLAGERSAGDRLLLVLADGMGGHAGGGGGQRHGRAGVLDRLSPGRG